MKQKILLGTGGYINDDENVYFAATNVSGFFQYNKAERKLSLLPIMSAKKKSEQTIGYVGICRYGEKIVFLPYYASELLIYDRSGKEELKRIHLKSRLPKSVQAYQHYLHAVPWGNLIYCIGLEDSELLCLDMDTESISVIESWKKAVVAALGNTPFVGIHTYDVCVLEGVLWTPIHAKNCVLELNLQTQEAKVHKAGVPDMQFATICFDGSNFWLTGDKRKIVKWNRNTGKIQITDKFPNGFVRNSESGQDYFYRSWYEQGYIYFFPMDANMALKVDIQTGKIEIFYQWDVPVSCNMIQKWEENSFHVEWTEGDSRPITNSMIIGLDGTVKDRDIFLLDDEEVEWPEYREDDSLYYENGVITLERFLDKKVCGREYRCAETYGAIGKKIFLEGKNSGQ